jgi:alanine racemase
VPDWLSLSDNADGHTDLKSWVEISSARLADNARALQTAAGAGVELLAVVKADGYGHGAEVVAPALAAAGVRWLGVSDLDEGARVRGWLGEGSTRLLAMVGMEAEDAPGIVMNGLTPVVWTAEHVAAMEKAARAVGQRIRVHLEVETGMARQGAAPGPELARVLERLQATRWVECEGLMTHLCESEVVGSAVTEVQRGRFEQALAQTLTAGVRPAIMHVGNSSAVDEGSTMPWIKKLARASGAKAMVRPGYAMYGHCLPLVTTESNGLLPGSALEGVGAEARVGRRLKPVMTWKARVIGCREIAAGATVGYGASFVASQPMRLALLPVGYADGFRRAASSGMGNGWVMLRGQRAPVVGRVSMNLTVVDVTAIKDARVGDDAVLLGAGVSAEDHAAWAETIGYDILCGIRARFVLR